MRLLLTLATLMLSMPGWSASSDACSNGDAAAVLAKMRQHILPAPGSPQNRWMVSKADEGWTITEYSGLRVFVRCRPVSKADELNGVLRGEIEFQYVASRTTRFPELTSAGIQWNEWSEWADHPKPIGKAQEAELAPLMQTMYRLALAADIRDRHLPFRKSKGNFQLEWEYDNDAPRPALMPAADVNRFLSTADAEAAKLRVAEAEAQQVINPAKMRLPVNPDDFYPPGSKRREEQGSPVVQACVGPDGRLLREPVVTDTSDFPDLDSAAIKVAQASLYAAGTDGRGTPLAESCLKFKVKFALDR